MLWVTSLVSLIFLGATGCYLLWTWISPHFLYVLLRPHWKSWLVKGVLWITVYGGLVTLLGAAHFFGYAEMADWFVWPVLVLSILLAIYTAFLFAQAKGRDFWQSPFADSSYAASCSGGRMCRTSC